jgi:hypothetical protein
MSEIDPDYTAIANDFTINLSVPEQRIDLRVILLALRYELLHQKIFFSPNFGKRNAHVIVPSLRYRFSTYYENGFMYVKIGRNTVKLPCFLEEDEVSERTIDLICAVTERYKINGYPSQF